MCEGMRRATRAFGALSLLKKRVGLVLCFLRGDSRLFNYQWRKLRAEFFLTLPFASLKEDPNDKNRNGHSPK